MPKIIVIIVTYNGERWIRTCLQDLQKSSCPAEVLVIDNASTDGTPETVRHHFPETVLIANTANTGFGQANNQGLEYALREKADYVFLLNQDAYVCPDTLEQLIRVQQQHAGYGIISPVQLNGSGEKIDDRFRIYLRRNYPEAFVKKIFPLQKEVPALLPVRFVNAAAWLIPRSCLERVGLFHPLFAHYGEDNNYASRAQYHGFKTGVCPTALVRHDRHTPSPDAPALLLRQVRTIPRYILLDLRKPFLLARLLAHRKLRRLYRKGEQLGDAAVMEAATEQLQWMQENREELRRVREEMKQPFRPVKQSS
ncbi:glycosyltransferase family 2 protein [Compostibacter hankyongensis]|uniref:Glycosyltransferase 2-like domain-containing protein n=1 Tax=Compostibacter hankyongensis TaxID=1007089 RepID=A0ABP8FWP2_9BACT